MPGIPGHSGAQRHRKAHGDGSKPTGLGQPALQRSPSAPLGVQVPLKSGPQHWKSGAEWGGEPRDEVSRLLPFHVQLPAGPGTACSECTQENICQSSQSPLMAALQHPQLNLPVHSCPGIWAFPCSSLGCSHLLLFPGLLQLRQGQRNTTNRGWRAQRGQGTQEATRH